VYNSFANSANQKNIEEKLADKMRNIKSMLRTLGALNPANYHRHLNSAHNDENEPSTSTSEGLNSI